MGWGGGEMQGRVVLVRVPSCGPLPCRVFRGKVQSSFWCAPTSIGIISGRAPSFVLGAFDFFLGQADGEMGGVQWPLQPQYTRCRPHLATPRCRSGIALGGLQSRPRLGRKVPRSLPAFPPPLQLVPASSWLPLSTVPESTQIREKNPDP